VSAGSDREGSSEPQKVRLVAATEERVAKTIEATGTLAAQDQVAVAMKVAGRISELSVDLGDRVRKGQVIARIDPTDLKIQMDQASAALQGARTRLGLEPSGTNEKIDPQQTALVKQARAALTQAKLNRDRAQQLVNSELIARSDLDAAVAAHQVAEGQYQDAVEEIRNRQAVLAQRRSELEFAKQQLAYAELVSPIDGAVVDRQSSVGQFLAAGTPVVTLVRVHPLRLRLPVPERAAGEVRVGQPVKIRVDQESGEYFGRITRLSPAIDQANRTLLVEAEVPNERGVLKPGSFVRAELTTAEQSSVFVPASALVTFAGLEKVITIENGKAVERAVRTARKGADRVEIAEGLKAGEQVVVRPGSLVGGQPVVVER
jgi:RND family efflux transporter MFP subunit